MWWGACGCHLGEVRIAFPFGVFMEAGVYAVWGKMLSSPKVA